VTDIHSRTDDLPADPMSFLQDARQHLCRHPKWDEGDIQAWSELTQAIWRMIWPMNRSAA